MYINRVNVESIYSSIYAYCYTGIVPTQQVINAVTTPIFAAYEAFRNSSTKARIMAESMERDSAHNVFVKSSSDPNTPHWADTMPNGNDFTIKLKSEMFEPYGLELWKQGNVIYEQVDTYILNTHPDFDYFSAIVRGGENAIPGGNLAITLGKWIYNGISAFYRVEKTHQTNWGEEFIDAGFGSIPVYGPIHGFAGELNRQQDFNDMMVAYYNDIGDSRGYYPFR